MRTTRALIAIVAAVAPVVLALPAAASTPGLAVKNTSGVESASVLRFTVTLSHSISARAYFDYKTVDGTALAGKDYKAVSGRTYVAAGSTQRVIKVPLLRDSRVEPTETVKLRISSPSRATIADAVGVGKIRDDDGPIVNEVMASPIDHTHQEKWVELYNQHSTAIVLDSWTLTQQSTSCALTGTVQAHGYYLVANSADPASNGELPTPDATCGNLDPSITGAAFTVTNPAAVVVDRFAFGTLNGGSIQAHDGKSLNLDPSYATPAGNDVTDHWCDATSAYGTAGNDGTPDAPNTACP